MLRSSILASTALAISLALGSSAASAAGDKSPAGQSAGQSSGQATKTKQQVSTKDYLERAGASDLFEIETGKLAMQRASNPEVKRFGEMMTKDHKHSTDLVQQAAAKSKDKPEAAKMSSHQQAVTRQLMGAEGSAFDRMYVQAQMDAHRQALELHRSYAANGEDPALKTAAAEITPVVEKHLAELRKLSNTVTGMK